MARTRIKTDSLQSWEEVDEGMKAIGKLDNSLTKIEADMNDEITKVKARAGEKTKPLLEEKKRLELAIKDYAETNRMDLKGKTKVMNYGQLGFRQSTSIIVKKIKSVLEALKAKKMVDCITVKETINKENLRKYADSIISEVGCSKKVEDVFWYEPDFTKLEK